MDNCYISVVAKEDKSIIHCAEEAIEVACKLGIHVSFQMGEVTLVVTPEDTAYEVRTRYLDHLNLGPSA